PTLSWASGGGVGMADGHEGVDVANEDSRSLLILSEPLDRDLAHWHAVPDSHLLVAGGGEVAMRPSAPPAGARPLRAASPRARTAARTAARARHAQRPELRRRARPSGRALGAGARPRRSGALPPRRRGAAVAR